MHVGSNAISGYRGVTPNLLRQDEALLSRARAFIRRELRVFEFLNSSGTEAGGAVKKPTNAEYLLQFIIAVIKTIDLKGSKGQAEDMIQEFLGRQNTRIFIHELLAWLRSPYTTLEAWDSHTQYTEVNAAAVLHHDP
jgi:hypothetical protein